MATKVLKKKVGGMEAAVISRQAMADILAKQAELAQRKAAPPLEPASKKARGTRAKPDPQQEVSSAQVEE